MHFSFGDFAWHISDSFARRSRRVAKEFSFVDGLASFGGLSVPLIIDLYLFFGPSSQDAEEDPAKIIANGEAKDGGEESW